MSVVIEPQHLIASSAWPLDAAGVKQELRLAWHDEFDDCPGGKPSAHTWIFKEGFQQREELNWWSADTTQCTDGRLEIEAKSRREGFHLFAENVECPSELEHDALDDDDEDGGCVSYACPA